MKQEDHAAQLWFAFILQAAVFLTRFSTFPHSYPVDLFLLADVFVGTSLLPVIAAFRRGSIIVKAFALLLSGLPVLYIYVSARKNGPLLLDALFDP
ncbi:MAG: hypothetical protein JNG86_20170 [Verrucomicrobiaceae bacterium]|nr:hypothetical protein [Verrucomicrobiaceae bacterium]